MSKTNFFLSPLVRLPADSPHHTRSVFLLDAGGGCELRARVEGRNPFPVARRLQVAREQAPEQHVRGRHADAPGRAGARRLLLLRCSY